ncbi:hypothetical protein ERX27_00550 [Macrococcus brunensis]|uniref:Carboxyltransferase domain-containing protein n=1 Tax=Macrococcus brunensis TaxID=198483 RepID=A0A4R6BGE6_9STAP|nr:hypothetical protein [Macrococcus brunensis]TDL98964.1 hypothetical protein ERX27_00550 [Macrococcus brunensis]
MIFEDAGLYTTYQTAKSDQLSHTIANALVGNDSEMPTFEMAMVPATVYFEEETLIALTGADYNAYTSEREIEMFKPHLMAKGETLHFGRAAKGTRVYLAVAGGVQEAVLNQKIEADTTFKLVHEYTDIQKKLIQKLSVVESCPWGVDFYSLSRVYYSDIFHIYPVKDVVIPDDEVYEVSSYLNRQSFTLEGPLIKYKERAEAQLNPGSIQVTVDQKLRVILTAMDGQEAVAQIAPYHFLKLVQKRPGSKLIFKNVSQEEYYERKNSYDHWVKSLLMQLSYQLKSYVSS